MQTDSPTRFSEKHMCRVFFGGPNCQGDDGDDDDDDDDDDDVLA